MIDVILNKLRFNENPFLILEQFAHEHKLYFADWGMWDNGKCWLVQFANKAHADEFAIRMGITAKLVKSDPAKVTDPRILTHRLKADGFTTIWKTPKHFPVKIGGNTYVPFQFAYDPSVKDYIWKFKRSDTLA